MVRAITVQPVYNGLVYNGHSAYYGHRTTSQNFQSPYIFCKVDLYIAVTLHIKVTGQIPKIFSSLIFSAKLTCM